MERRRGGGGGGVVYWAIPLNKGYPPIDDVILFDPWDRRQHMLLVSFPDPEMGLGTRLHMLHDPGTDFHYFTTPRQMDSKQGPAPGTEN